MAKGAEAFRSIGEVATLIGVAPHVLRYWETQFSALKPMKRPDGRRYYRPADVEMAAGICALLRDDGLTIRGAIRQIATDRGQSVATARLAGTPQRYGASSAADFTRRSTLAAGQACRHAAGAGHVEPVLIPACDLSKFSAPRPLCWPAGSLYSMRVGPWRSLVSASVWGAEGREFESLRPDHSENAHPFPRVGVSLIPHPHQGLAT